MSVNYSSFPLSYLCFDIDLDPLKLIGAHITLLPQLKRGEERRGMVEVYDLIALVDFGFSVNDSQVLGERLEFEVVRAGPSYPIRYWRGQEAVYRWNRKDGKKLTNVRLWVRGEGLTGVATAFGGTGFRPPRF